MKLSLPSLSLLSLFTFLGLGATASADDSLTPVPPNLSPGAKYADDTRIFQGISGLERAANGRLWATWYAGGQDEFNEGPGNYVVLVTSGDDGRTWSQAKMVIDPPGLVRAYDATLWVDPSGKLWFFWAQSHHWWDGRSGVWAITTENAGDENPTWTAPRRLGNGIMMNKPTVLASGDWILPVSVWRVKPESGTPREARYDLGAEKGANAWISKDQGQTFNRLGQVQVPKSIFDEHQFVQRRDGTLWGLLRTQDGTAESTSTDGGKTWSPGTPVPLSTVNSRFFIRRLLSGKLLLVSHQPPDGRSRSHLTARLSSDEGKTWSGGLLLDERLGISYPDGVQAPDGTIYITYDYSRAGDKTIYMTTFTEEDVVQGRRLSDKSRPRIVINQATGQESPGPVLQATAIAVVLNEGTKLFSDAALTAPSLPQSLQGLTLLQNPQDQPLEITTRKGGVVFVITPCVRPGFTEETQVARLGFAEVQHQNFKLSEAAPYDRVRILRKKLADGEKLTLPKGVILVAPQGTEIVSPKPAA